MNVFNDKTEIALCILHIHVIIAVVCMQLTCFFGGKNSQLKVLREVGCLSFIYILHIKHQSLLL